MAFGISVGGNKSNSKGTQSVDSTVTQNQSTTGNNSSTGTTSTSGSTTQTGSTTGTSNQATSGTTNQTGTSTGKGTQSTSLFSSDVLGGIEGAVKSLFGALGGPAKIDAASLTGFDPTAYVANGMKAAEATTRTGLDEAIGTLNDSVGGTAGTNSAIALLQQRLNSDASANLAGVRGNLTGQAEQINRENVLAGNAINSTSQQFLATLLDVLKGGVATSTTAEQQSQSTAGNTTGMSAGTTSENSSQAQNTQSTQMQTLMEQISQLLAGTTNTKGTQVTTETGTKVGGGVSYSG